MLEAAPGPRAAPGVSHTGFLLSSPLYWRGGPARAGLLPVLTNTQCPAGGGARPDSGLCPSWASSFPSSVAWKLSSRGLSVPLHISLPDIPQPGLFQRLWPPHPLPCGVTDRCASWSSLGEPGIPIQSTVREPKEGRGFVCIYARICSKILSTYFAGWFPGTES